MLRPPTQWGCAIMLTFLAFLCLIIACHSKPLQSLELQHGSTTKRISISNHNTENNILAKRNGGEQEGSYHRGVPEHFVMSEHGPEIHLDIDEHGTTVDTHPAALSMDTATHPHEHCCHHCCHHCEHHCHCCCGHGECRKREFKHRKDEENDYHPLPHLVEQTGVVRKFPRFKDCYGGVCRDQLAEYNPLQPQTYQLYGRPTHETPPQIVYSTVLSSPNDEHRNGFGRITHDSRVEHETGDIRGRIQYSPDYVVDHSRPRSEPYQALWRPAVEPDHTLYNTVERSKALLQQPALEPIRTVYNTVEGSKAHATDLHETKVNVEHHISFRNITYDSLHPEPDKHVTGKTRGTIDKYLPVKDNQLVGNYLTLHTEKGEGTLITFDHQTSGGLALRNGHVPQHYGLSDINPDELSLKRSKVNVNMNNKKLVTQLT